MRQNPSCQQCGACLRLVRSDGRRTKPHRFCSAKCRNQSYKTVCGCGNEKEPDSQSCLTCKIDRLRRLESVCRGCGKSYMPKASNRRSFCSRECAFEHCPPPHNGSPVADQSLAERLYASIRKVFDRALDRVRPCAGCGQSFFAKSWQRTCSKECRQDLKRSVRKKMRAKGMAHRKHRERARYFGVAYEPIRPAEIFARDGWKCALCGGLIKLQHKVPHPRSATLDHIIPMSKGGPHLRTNVQAAHFICNSRKGASSKGEQLRLVG